ncbi:hypothetical protein QTP88_014603 [Uroleucon formosanum]
MLSSFPLHDFYDEEVSDNLLTHESKSRYPNILDIGWDIRIRFAKMLSDDYTDAPDLMCHEKGTKVMFDGSDKPRLALAHTITKVHLNKRNISQPEHTRVRAYTHLKPSSHRAPQIRIYGCWGGRRYHRRRAKGVIDTDLRLWPNRIDYISHTARNNVIIIVIGVTNKFQHSRSVCHRLLEQRTFSTNSRLRLYGPRRQFQMYSGLELLCASSSLWLDWSPAAICNASAGRISSDEI